MAEIAKLLDGYKQFHAQYFNSDNKLYTELHKGQSPKTLVIACSDSRVDPAILTSADPGDIFVIRNVANLVPPYEKDDKGHHGVSAALEFAVCVLGISNIVVLGHSNCAGIKALVDNTGIHQTDFIERWMDVAEPARDAAFKVKESGESNEEAHHICEKEAITFSLKNLQTFPWIKAKIDSGDLRLHGWYFMLSDGSLQSYNHEKHTFENV